MKEKELEILLYRDKIKIEASQIYQKQIEVLVDMVNYGTNLIIRAYDSSKKKLEDIIVIVVLLKQIVSMIDAIEVLASQGIVNPAFLPLRSAFEASLYIDWIIKSESKKKAEYYYVSNLRNTRLWTLRFLTGTNENIEFSRYMEDLKDALEPSSITKMQEEEAKKQVTNIDRVLKQEGYREINAMFENRRRGKSRIDVQWYQLLGIESIRKLAEEVGRLSGYYLYYTRGSDLMHTTSYRDHIKFKKNKAIFEPVRQLENMSSLLELTMGLCLHSYLSIINKYRQGERTIISSKYKADWQAAFQTVPTINSVEEIHSL